MSCGLESVSYFLYLFYPFFFGSASLAYKDYSKDMSTDRVVSITVEPCAHQWIPSWSRDHGLYPDFEFSSCCCFQAIFIVFISIWLIMGTYASILLSSLTKMALPISPLWQLYLWNLLLWLILVPIQDWGKIRLLVQSQLKLRQTAHWVSHHADHMLTMILALFY